MIIEDYVSFETAKLLKEKGFNEPCCHALYHNDEDKIFFGLDVDSFVALNVDCYACPTIQMVMKWLREVHKIFLNINFIPEHSCFTYRVVHNGVEEKFVVYPSTYEDACESAIRYCLENLI